MVIDDDKKKLIDAMFQAVADGKGWVTPNVSLLCNCNDKDHVTCWDNGNPNPHCSCCRNTLESME